MDQVHAIALCRGWFNKGTFTADDPQEFWKANIKKDDVVRFVTEGREEVTPDYVGVAWLCKEVVN